MKSNELKNDLPVKDSSRQTTPSGETENVNISEMGNLLKCLAELEKGKMGDDAYFLCLLYLCDSIKTVAGKIGELSDDLQWGDDKKGQDTGINISELSHQTYYLADTVHESINRIRDELEKLFDAWDQFNGERA